MNMIFGIPAANAKAHNIKATLLNDKQWQALLNASSPVAAMNVVLNSAYGKYFSYNNLASDAQLKLREIEHTLYSSVIDIAKKLLRFMDGETKTFFIAWLYKYELLNIKKALRYNSSSERRDAHLEIADYNLESFALVKNVDWNNIESTQKIGTLLKHTFLGTAYRRALAAYTEKKDVYLFEITLEREYYKYIKTCCNNLDVFNRYTIEPILKEFLDEIIVSSMLRLKYNYNIDDSTISTLIHGIRNSSIRSDDFWKILDARTKTDSLEILKKLGGKWNYIVDCNSLSNTIRALRKYRIQKYRKAVLIFDVSKISTILQLLCIKEQEVADIIAVLQAKRFKQELTAKQLITVNDNAAAF